MTLHLIRHGRPFQDDGPRSNWPLDPMLLDGVVRLRDSGVIPRQAHWYSSPERRAVETTRALTDVEPQLVVELREQRRPDRRVDGFENLVERTFRFHETPPAQGWETAISVGDRLMRFISTLPTERDIVLVGHGTAWTILVALLTGAEPDIAAWRSMGFPDHCSIEEGRVVSAWSQWTSAK